MPKGTVVKVSLSTLGVTVIETEFAKVSCLENRAVMETKNAGGAGMLTVAARVSTMTFDQCTVPDGGTGTENCSVKTVNIGAAELEQWQGIFEKGKTGNGIFSISSSKLGTFGFTVVCKEKVEKINCTFTNPTSSTFIGGVVATISGEEKMKPMAGGAKCPTKEPEWRFKWLVLEPDPLYLVAE
ncbi:MAG TPA: hypothetical protein VGG40_07460 [Solirubrobacterales bacterium]